MDIPVLARRHTGMVSGISTWLLADRQIRHTETNRQTQRQRQKVGYRSSKKATRD